MTGAESADAVPITQVPITHVPGTQAPGTQVPVAQVLIDQARAGDHLAFRELTEPYRHELRVHCYRLLGGLDDADDALQDTLLAAWQGLAGYRQDASIRTWLYRIATNRCLNVLRAARRRPDVRQPSVDFHRPEPTRLTEVVRLEPYPDALLAGLPDTAPGPEARYETTEAISLAFVAALQLLPARQRVVLVLRDVLGFPAREVATMLDITTDSVTSALKRARVTLARRLPPTGHRPPPPAPNSPVEADLAARLASAYQHGDVDALVALLTDDVTVTMPPAPLEYVGPEQAGRFHAAVSFRQGRTYHLVMTRANGSLAFAAYLRGRDGQPGQAMGLLVFTLTGNRVRAITRFDPGVLGHFGMPPTGSGLPR